jgi:hypothetical protein
MPVFNKPPTTTPTPSLLVFSASFNVPLAFDDDALLIFYCFFGAIIV